MEEGWGWDEREAFGRARLPHEKSRVDQNCQANTSLLSLNHSSFSPSHSSCWSLHLLSRHFVCWKEETLPPLLRRYSQIYHQFDRFDEQHTTPR